LDQSGEWRLGAASTQADATGGRAAAKPNADADAHANTNPTSAAARADATSAAARADAASAAARADATSAAARADAASAAARGDINIVVYAGASRGDNTDADPSCPAAEADGDAGDDAKTGGHGNTATGTSDQTQVRVGTCRPTVVDVSRRGGQATRGSLSDLCGRSLRRVAHSMTLAVDAPAVGFAGLQALDRADPSLEDRRSWLRKPPLSPS